MNVTGQARPTAVVYTSKRGKAIAKRQLVGRSLDPLVGPEFLHFSAVFRAVGADNRKIGLKIAFSGSQSTLLRFSGHIFMFLAVAEASSRPLRVFLFG